MAETADRPEIIECEIRLHAGSPSSTTEVVFDDWIRTVVGDPVTFRAVAITGRGLWNGPLPPGVEIAAPTALPDPYWTVFLPASTGVPVMTGRVGHPMAVGETFALVPEAPGTWVEGIVFDGAIVTE